MYRIASVCDSLFERCAYCMCNEAWELRPYRGSANDLSLHRNRYTKNCDLCDNFGYTAYAKQRVKKEQQESKD